MLRLRRSVVVTESVLLLLATTACVTHNARAQAVAEADSFRLHKFAQPIGWEHYRITPDSGSLRITSSFEFTDRGSRVPLQASARLRMDLSPVALALKGRVSRLSGIDAEVHVAGGTATIRLDSTTTQKVVTGPAFSIGYVLIVLQQNCPVLGAPRPAVTTQTLPTGSVKITARRDTVTMNGKRVPLRRCGRVDLGQRNGGSTTCRARRRSHHDAELIT
jgi:hypothetical protein